MFEDWGFIFRKAVVPAVMLQYALHSEIEIKGCYKISKYKVFEPFIYIDMDLKYCNWNLVCKYKRVNVR